jgi:hypothetical protein
MMIGGFQGREIDSFDVVVKTNGLVFLQEDLKEHFGARCDVLYTNTSFAKEMAPLPVKKFVAKGVKFLCMKKVSEDNLALHNTVIKTKRCGGGVPGVTGPLMGAILLNDLLSCKPASVHMTGVDFYIDHRNEYYAGYQPPVIQKIIDDRKAGKRKKVTIKGEKRLRAIHPRMSNLMYFWRVFKRGQITMDTRSKQYLAEAIKKERVRLNKEANKA